MQFLLVSGQLVLELRFAIDKLESQIKKSYPDMQTNISSSDNPSSEEQKPQRRSNVERSAATRSKVIAAAIQCLYELGYEGTTVILVAKRAGVSRGAAQHQFPSKVDLMMAVTAHVVEQLTHIRKDFWENIPKDMGHLSQVAETSWDYHSQPENVALFEIMMATRNDEELHDRFMPFSKQMADLRTYGAESIAEHSGIPMRPELEALVRLHFSAMRGIAMDYLLNKDEEGARAAVNLLTRYQRVMIEQFVAESKNINTSTTETTELVG